MKFKVGDIVIIARSILPDEQPLIGSVRAIISVMPDYRGYLLSDFPSNYGGWGDDELEPYNATALEKALHGVKNE